MIIVGVSKLEYETHEYKSFKHYMYLHDNTLSNFAKLCKIIPSDFLILKCVFLDLRNIKL